jgi:hypothetical protein
VHDKCTIKSEVTTQTDVEEQRRVAYCNTKGASAFYIFSAAKFYVRWYFFEEADAVRYM